MSRTPNIGVVGVKYWAYMAKVMAGCLDQIIKGQKTEIPIGIFSDARKFFNIVLERETGDAIFDNSLAQGDAFAIAWEILDDCLSLQPRTFERANEHFCRFAKFLESLENQPTVPFCGGHAKQPVVPLSAGDQKPATDLRDFFAALVRKNDRDFDYGESRD